MTRLGKFSYTISEAYHAKKRQQPSTQFSDNRHLPTTYERAKTRPHSGEDSFFYTATDNTPRGIAFGVADGVGGWAESGVDPSEFSQALCDEMSELFTAYLTQTSTPSNGGSQLPSPKALLDKAYANIVDQAVIQAGGSTACVGVVSTSTGTLHTANLGDSGFAVFRSGKIAIQSKPQLHAFNTPFQLAILPKHIRDFEARQPAHSSRHILDYPKDADTSSFQLKSGDVVVLSTDGFLDNISSSEALAIVTDTMIRQNVWTNHPTNGFTPSLHISLTSTAAGALASHLVKAAHAAAHDPHKLTPFAKEVQHEMRIQYKGGKPDDITILVIYVSEKLSSSI